VCCNSDRCDVKYPSQSLPLVSVDEMYQN